MSAETLVFLHSQFGEVCMECISYKQKALCVLGLYSHQDLHLAVSEVKWAERCQKKDKETHMSLNMLSLATWSARLACLLSSGICTAGPSVLISDFQHSDRYQGAN